MAYSEEVIKELEPIGGRYRVRVVEGKSGRAVDVREYVKTSSYEGFTKKGIRLRSAEEVNALIDELKLAAEELTG